MSYLDYNCRKCSAIFHYQIPRPFILKHILGFLPIRIYWCPKCKKNRYVWIDTSPKMIKGENPTLNDVDRIFGERKSA